MTVWAVAYPLVLVFAAYVFQLRVGISSSADDVVECGVSEQLSSEWRVGCSAGRRCCEDGISTAE